MKILIVADEVWNDRIHGNNVLTNWFDGFDAQFAEIYCSPGMPDNACCERYFQLTDAMMIKSFAGKRAGQVFRWTREQMVANKGLSEQTGMTRMYRFMKSITNEPLRVLRDLIWLYGRYDMQAMKRFVEEFDPDIVFCPRLLTPKLLRLERTIASFTQAPMVAFTGDDEASMQQVSYSPVFWVRRWLFRRAFNRNMKIYSHYFMHSAQQAQTYTRLYGIPTETLFKSGNFEGKPEKKSPHAVIKMVYAGRLYCNRWKTLAAIGDALRDINKNGEKIALEIYTPDKLTKKQAAALLPCRHIHFGGCVPPLKLREIYANADIALHVESFDKRSRYATRVSFSTKIIDCMASSCAVMAICWEQQTGFRYLQDNDAAFCISSYDQILPTLRKICDRPELIACYADKAWRCGQRYHSKICIQRQLRQTFYKLIARNESIDC